MAEQDVPPHLPGPTYVTRLAWILIVAAGIALPVSIYQNVLSIPVSFWAGIWLVRVIVKLASREIRAEFLPTCPGPH